MTRTVYLSLGSNLGDRAGNLRSAISAVAADLPVTAISAMYETEPVGVRDQPSFYNLALAVQTNLAPPDVLARLKYIEIELGRRPTFRWGPRVIDIDLLLYEDAILETPHLTVPHPRLAERAFVLVPLAEIAPQAVHPVLGQTIAALRDAVPGRETVRLLPL